MVGRGLWPADCDGWALMMPADCDGWALMMPADCDEWALTMPADCDGWALLMPADCLPHQVLGAAVVRIGPPVRAALCASSPRMQALITAPRPLSAHRYAPPSVLRQVVPAHASAHHGAILSLSLPTGTRHLCFVKSCACSYSRAVASPWAIAATCRKSSGSACFDACTARGCAHPLTTH
jgi:hypothetical protein